MKALITLGLIVAVYLLCKGIINQYEAKQQRMNEPPKPAVLDGLPLEYEASLAEAQSRGATALREWLTKYGHNARDPRLAEIQLDYVVLLSRSNPTEAKQLFNAIRRRTPKSSPLNDRIKRLEPAYGN